MKHMRKVFTLVLVLAMVLSLAAPALAAEAGKVDITIKQEFSQIHIYEAYQIFSGTVNTDDILTDIKWGLGVDGAKIVSALRTNTATAAVFNDASIVTAAQVAEKLSENSTNTALVHAFRHIVAENLTSQKATSNDPVDGIYTIPNVDPGYYFIKDQDGSLDDDETYTNYILEVVGATNITPKGGKVTHDKLIEDGGNRLEAADYSIGDDVKFVLRGTLPENYDVFSDYAYKFVDILSSGLSFNNDVRVYLENAGNKMELEKGFAVNVGTAATVDGATFTVDFADLKNIPNRTIDSHTVIIVEYTAKLNANAVIGGNGNVNESYVRFDNNPHVDSQGETPHDKVFVFTWQLNANKTDAKNKTELADARFVLYREQAGKKQYVKLDEKYCVAGWVQETAEGGIPTDATTLISDAEGDFKIIGLEADTYHLKETKAPEGYNLLVDPIKVDIRAEVSENAAGTPVITKLEIKVDNNPIVDGNTSTGVVGIEIVNNPGAMLPQTGGMGTTLFYVFGGIMVAAAVVLLVTKKRMGNKN